MNDKNIMVNVHDQNMESIHLELEFFIHLCQEYQSFKKYLPLMQQQIIMINIVMTTKGPAGINIFKFDSALACH
jgi:P2-related tail formation protein